MPFARGALRFQRFLAAKIKSRGAGREIRSPAATLHKAVAVEIQTKFHAAWMKTRRPVELAFRQEIVPFDAVAYAAKTAEERLPARADIAPRRAFTERGFLHRAAFGGRILFCYRRRNRTHVEDKYCGTAVA